MEFYSVVKIKDDEMIADIVEFESGEICIYWHSDKSILLYLSMAEFWNDYIKGSTFKIIKDGVDENDITPL
jgi:hypothetical protein